MIDPGVMIGLAETAAATLRACALQPEERVAVLADTMTARPIREAFLGALAILGASSDPVVLTLSPRRPAFADLPPQALDALLAADMVIDLTSVPWLYSDSFTRFTQECASTGTRLALIWGDEGSVRTLAACPPSPELAARCREGMQALARARTLHVRSGHGTNVVVELGEPAAYPRAFIGEPPTRPGMIGAPLCASITAPFVSGTAEGRIVFVGAGRFQGPENRPIRAAEPVVIEIEAVRVVRVEGEDPAAAALREWFSRVGEEDGRVVMDCNLGFDLRAELAWADNTVVHSFAGGVMFGLGNPYEYRPEGSRRPGYHLDLMLPGCDVDLDGVPFDRGG